jgi:hypothetical protein
MEQPPLVRNMQQITGQHDLEGLRRQIIQALDAVPEHERPHVPQFLAKALAQFIDSYSTQPSNH